MAIKGALTTTFSVSAALVTDPPTEVKYEALTWTACGEVTSIGEFGREYNVVAVNNLASGATRKFKGSYNQGTMQVEMLFDSADAGQTIIEAAGDSINKYAFRVGLPGMGAAGEEFYFQALVTMVKRVVGGPDEAIMLNFTLELDHTSIIEGT